MKKRLLTFAIATILVSATLMLAACSSNAPTPIEARAIYELNRIYLDGQPADVSETVFPGSMLTFAGEESGGNILIRIGEDIVQASINPSRDHPSYEDGYWHHHLYAGVTEAGSPRINFRELLPYLGIDDNLEATDNTQSSYQRGNLHYIVDTGEFRLRLTIDGITNDLIFIPA